MIQAIYTIATVAQEANTQTKRLIPAPTACLYSSAIGTFDCVFSDKTFMQAHIFSIFTT